jgi:hypothetical protein
METGVAGEKPLLAKLRADYFNLSLFLYLQFLHIFLLSIYGGNVGSTCSC